MATITFEQLDPTPTPAPAADGEAVLRLIGYGHALPPAQLGAIGDGLLVVVQTEDAADIEPPVYATGDGLVFVVQGYSYAAGTGEPAAGDGSLWIVGVADESGSVGDGRLLLIGEGSQAASAPPAPYPVEVLNTGLTFDAASSSLQTALLRARLRLEEHDRSRWQGTRTLRAALTLEDGLAVVHRELLQVSLQLGAGSGVAYTAVEQMIDALLLGGAVGSHLEAVQLIVEALTFGDVLGRADIATLTDGLNLGAAVAASYTAMTALVDRLLLSDAMAPGVVLAAVMRDDLALGAAGATALEAHSVLRDRLDFMLRLSLDNTEYVAWAINTESKGLSRYTQYPFNSFMKVGGRYYGATDTGLYRLDGADDAGEPITAKLRLGLSALGTRRMKRLPSMYAGYTASGDLLLKVIVADAEDGQREAHCYRLLARAAGSTREGRVPIGRGLKSVYWDFEIENVDGADFELDVIEFLPLLLDRRVRGNSGGKR